jgi:hypothetical protein
VVSDVTECVVCNHGVTENSLCVAWWDNDWPYVAYNEDNSRVVGINGYVGTFNRCWTGDMLQGVLNAVLFVSGTSQDVPTLSEWGMMFMGLLLLMLGTIAVVRRRKTAVSRAA